MGKNINKNIIKKLLIGAIITILFATGEIIGG